LIHSNIVVTYDAATDEEQDLPFIVMELVDGRSLDDRIKREGKIAWKEALDIIIPVAQALAYASDFGIVHRDVKPANVLLSTEGTPKLTDFGIAKLPTSSLTKKGIVLGTPAFISPEQLRGEELDGRADIFSLGAVLYTAIVGESPFAGPELPVIFHKLVTQDPEWPSQIVKGVPPTLDSVISKMLAKDRESRYTSGAELAQDLLAVRSGEESTVSFMLPEDEDAGELSESTEVTSEDDVGEITVGSTLWRFARWFVMAAILAAVTYGVVLGPERAIAQARSILHRLEPVWSWVQSRTENIESTLRHSKGEREEFESQQTEVTRLLVEGDQSSKRGQWDGARRAYQGAIEISNSIEDGGRQCQGLLARGRLMANIGKWERSRADFNAVVRLGRLFEEDEARAFALLEIGNLERDLGLLDQAERQYNEARMIADTLESGEIRAAISVEHSLLLMMQRRWGRAEQQLESIVHTDGETGHDIRLQREVLLGAIAAINGDAQSADSVWKGAAELCGREDHEDCAELLLWRARALIVQGELELAKPLFSRAYDIYKRSGHLPGSAAALENLAEIAERTGKIETADEIWTAAKDVRSRLGVGALLRQTELDDDASAEWRRFVALLGASPRTALSENRRAYLAGIN
jgi:tetratricopeptide (TPR) repeat protein